MPLKVVTGTKPTAVSALVEDFLADCRARGKSQKTIRWSYGYPLRSILLPYCNREGITEPTELTSKVLGRVANELRENGGKDGRPLTEVSIHAYLRVVNTMLNWARGEGENVGNGRAKLPTLAKRLPDILDRAEIQAMEDAVATERDQLIIRLLADSGIRVGELVKLRPRDISDRKREHLIKIDGKGSRDRFIVVPASLHHRLERYAARKGRPDRLFLGLRRDRRTGEYMPLTESGVLQMIQTAAVNAGITKRVYPHLLRHSYATWYQQNHGNPILLAQQLGHSSLRMIQTTYSHLTPGDAYAEMLKVFAE